MLMLTYLPFMLCGFTFQEEASPAKQSPIDALPVDQAAAQFANIKSLVGEWYLTGGNQLGRELEPNLEKPFVTYALTAGGHCVIEKLFVGQPKEMTTIYHLDEGRLVLAHYCSLGNQPHMVAVPGKDNEITFRLTEVGNMPNENDLHISSHSLELHAEHEMTAHWGATKDKKPANQSKFRVLRK